MSVQYLKTAAVECGQLFCSLLSRCVPTANEHALAAIEHRSVLISASLILRRVSIAIDAPIPSLVLFASQSEHPRARLRCRPALHAAQQRQRAVAHHRPPSFCIHYIARHHHRLCAAAAVAQRISKLYECVTSAYRQHAGVQSIWHSA